MNPVSVLVVLAALCGACLSQNSGPKCTIKLWGLFNYGTYDCPVYTSETIADKTERRVYTGPVNWMSVSGSDSSPMFMKLFGYIGGKGTAENVEGKKMEMTMPVPKKFDILPNNGYKLSSMSFYIAEPNPPKANDADVYPETWSNKKVYTRTFSRTYFAFWTWPSDKDFNDELDNLRTDLDSAGLAYKEGSYLTSQLSAPWSFTKTAEVWVEAA